jgi:hypothetical protein
MKKISDVESVIYWLEEEAERLHKHQLSLYSDSEKLGLPHSEKALQLIRQSQKEWETARHIRTTIEVLKLKLTGKYNEHLSSEL